MSGMYPESAGGRQAAPGPPDSGPSGGPPPPALKVGDPVMVHVASCESPDQHERVTITGRVVERYPDGATLAEFPDGSRFELCPWFTSDCPNARQAVQEAA